MRHLGLAVLAAFALGAGVVQPAAAEEKLTAVLSDDAGTLSYTPCAEEEAAECVAYALDCRGDSGFGDALRVTIMGNEEAGPNVRALAKVLLDKPFGEAKLSYAVGGAKGDMVITAYTVSQNEMDGDWTLELYTYDRNSFLDSIVKASPPGATLGVAGHTISLSPDARAAERLLKFKTACAH